jgi:phosphoribosylamine---glycine ligase
LIKYDNVLIIGSGGREHCLGWKISQSSKVKKIFFAPGNGGTETNVPLAMDDLDRLCQFAKDNSCLTVVGPERPLALGVVDLFDEYKLPIFGPNKRASRLEWSKVYAKQFMNKYGIPTAPFSTFSDAGEAEQYVNSLRDPPVIKVDGLAQGKGVVVSSNCDEAIKAIRNFTSSNNSEKEPIQLVVEKKLCGIEISFIALCDGTSIMPLVSSQDHKRANDNDLGPNTGGMGAFSPVPFINSELYHKILKRIIDPTLRGLKDSNIKFKGFLYAGLMIEHNTKEPYVLEFNVRMGDPECQSIITRMESDLVDYLEATIKGSLNSMLPIEWKQECAVCVVMTSRGYPGKYETGKVIYGLDTALRNDVYVFHSGTTKDQLNRLITNGGRVLSVTGIGHDIRTATNRAYSAVKNIHWGNNEEYYRKDIGSKALQVNTEGPDFHSL